MPLDPQLAALLAGPDAPRLPSLEQVSPAQARALHREAALRAREAPGGAAETRRIPGPAGELELRRYEPAAPLADGDTAPHSGGPRPADGDAAPHGGHSGAVPRAAVVYLHGGRGGAAPRAAVVYLHGGGWVLGDLDVQEPTCRSLADATGAAVFAVAYRLAPEHPYPAALEDACATIRWVHDHVGDVAVAGSSAGANLAAAATLRLRDDGGPQPAAQLLLYPPTDPLLRSPSVAENADGCYLTAEDMRAFVEAYLPDPAARGDAYAGPLHAGSLAGLPPAVITTAGFDPLRDEGVAYADRLRADGVAVTHLHYPELIHGYFGFAELVDAAARARDEVLAAFRDLLAA